MNEKQMQFDWSFGLQWMIAYGIGIMLLGMLAFASIWNVGEIVEDNFGETATFVVVGALFGALMGLGASGGTSLLVRSKGVNAARWIAYSMVGGALGGTLGFGVALGLLDPETLPEVLVGLVIGISLGLPIGIGQLELIAQGYNNAEIGRKLTISIKTVHNHVSNIFSKLQVVDRAQAIIRAREAGLGR